MNGLKIRENSCCVVPWLLNIEPKLAQKFFPAPPASPPPLLVPLKKKKVFFFFLPSSFFPLKMKTFYKTFEGHMVGGISDDRDNFSVCLALALQSPCVVVTLSIYQKKNFLNLDRHWIFQSLSRTFSFISAN